MYSSEYYVPSHITGFFVPYFSDDCLKTGSTGAGVTLSLGLNTKINVYNGNGKVKVKLNGKKMTPSTNPISFKCLNIIKERYPKFITNKDIFIEQESDVPVGSGYGTSASAVLGICFSLKDLVNISVKDCIRIAHEAEVKNLSGLGAVSYTHLRAHETVLDLVCRLLLEKKKKQAITTYQTVNYT